jgi:hypothetical protein
VDGLEEVPKAAQIALVEMTDPEAGLEAAHSYPLSHSLAEDPVEAHSWARQNSGWGCIAACSSSSCGHSASEAAALDGVLDRHYDRFCCRSTWC